MLRKMNIVKTVGGQKGLNGLEGVVRCPFVLVLDSVGARELIVQSQFGSMAISHKWRHMATF